MTPLRFLETNVLLRHITLDHEFHAQLTEQLFMQMADGIVEGLLSMTVVFETVYVLEGVYGRDRGEVDRAIRFVSNAEGVRMLDGELDHLDRALKLYVQIRKLSFADCYHAVLSQSFCNGEICTFDKDFDRVPELIRLEPGQ